MKISNGGLVVCGISEVHNLAKFNYWKLKFVEIRTIKYIGVIRSLIRERLEKSRKG